MDLAKIREQSGRVATDLGFSTNVALPLLDAMTISRSTDEVVGRVFGMLAVVASAYGFDRRIALEWLQREQSLEFATSIERAFLEGATMNPSSFIAQIEGMWALCWSLGVVDELDFSGPCSSEFVRLLPDLKKDESGTRFRQLASLRPTEDVIFKCDLAYCLSWGAVHSGIPSKLKKAITPSLIFERRRALEWLLSSENWDEITLDT